MLKKNADALKTATVETAKESERGIVDIETLTKTNQMLMDTMDEVLTIQKDGKQRRAEAEAKEKAQKAEKEAVKAAKAQAAKEATQAQTPPAEAPAPEPAAEDTGEKD